MSNKKGFTLIELLVTMTIIAVLAGLALVSYEGTRKSARDSQRKTGLEQIRSALEMFRADNGRYPTDAETLSVLVSFSGMSYLAAVPSDPINTRNYSYNPQNGNTPVTYVLCSALETVTSLCTGCDSCNSCGSTCSYRVNSP